MPLAPPWKYFVSDLSRVVIDCAFPLRRFAVFREKIVENTHMYHRKFHSFVSSQCAPFILLVLCVYFRAAKVVTTVACHCFFSSLLFRCYFCRGGGHFSHRLRRSDLRARLPRVRGEHAAVPCPRGDLGAALALPVGSLVRGLHHRRALPGGSPLRDGAMHVFILVFREKFNEMNVNVEVI